MTKSIKRFANVRRAATATLLLASALSSVACSGPYIKCPGGRTPVDGVCADNKIADYVTCVRARGASLDEQRKQDLSANLGYLQATVGGALELSQSLAKKYSGSDQVTMAVIDSCKFLLPESAQTAVASNERQSLEGKWSGMATEFGKQVPVRLKVGGQGPGVCAALAYPTLGCTSVLHCGPPAADGSISGIEQLVKGRGRCADRGRITLSPQPNGTVSFLWKGNPNHNTAMGTLARDYM
jgi:hypothetical protein